MRILMLSDLWRPFPGGAENYVFCLASALYDRGHEINVVTSYEKAEAGHSDFHLIQELDLGKREDKESRAEMLYGHVAKINPDIIFIHRYFAEEYGHLVVQWGTPVIEVVHQHKKLPNAKFYIYNTEYTRRMNGAENDSNSMVILPPFSQDSLADITQPKGNMIGFVKPLPGKGADFFYELADRMPDERFLVLRGEWQSCETIVEKRNIKFIDPVKHMYEFYRCCRIVLMPSLSEDAGTIPIECAHNAIPCISSNVMGLPETNAGGVVLHHDIDRWVQAIVNFDDPKYYQSVCINQMKYVGSLGFHEKFNQLNERLGGLR